MDDEGNISLETMPRAAIAPSSLSQHLLRPNDLLISRSGTCGIAAVFEGHDVETVPGAFLIRFRLHNPVISRFYRLYFNSSLGRPRLERLAVGGVQKNIKGSEVLSLLVPVMPADEAMLACERVSAMQESLGSYVEKGEKLRLLKAGLMEDLLTGRVRVTSLLPADAEAP